MKTIKLLLLSLLFFVFACSQKKINEEVIQTVKTDTAQVYGEKQKVTFPGKVKAASDVNLSFRISGPIAKIYVNEGNYVKKGQTLAKMDARDYEIQLSATEAEYKQIKAEAERVIELYGKGSVTPERLRQSRLRIETNNSKIQCTQECLDRYPAPCTIRRLYTETIFRYGRNSWRRNADYFHDQCRFSGSGNQHSFGGIYQTRQI